MENLVLMPLGRNWGKQWRLRLRRCLPGSDGVLLFAS